MASPARLVLIGDDELAREGLAHIISEEVSGFRIVSSLTPARAERDMSGEEADVALWDLGSGETEELTTAELFPAVALVSSEAAARDAVSAGARGILRRAVTAARLESALGAVLTGLFVIDEELADAVLRPRAAPLPTAEELTPRELEVVQQLSLGLTNKEIAEALGVSAHTVKFHVNSLLSKLGASSRTEVVAMAARAGLITF